MHIHAMTFTWLIVGGYETVAEGSVTLDTDTAPVHFYLRWCEGPTLCAVFSPEQHELREIELELLREYRRVVYYALYGRLVVGRRKALTTNLKVLRIGHGWSCAKAAARLDIRTSTFRAMERGLYDFEADILKYVNPADALLFRAAALYGIHETDIDALATPYFFLRCRVEGWCYEFGEKSQRQSLRVEYPSQIDVEEDAQ